MFWYVSWLLLIIWTLQLKFIQDILKRYHFDLPVGIEHDYANWEKISTFVGYSLTQSRARVKKLVCDSTILPIIWITLFLYIDQGKHKVEHECVFSCTGDCPLYTLSSNHSALCPCCAHGKWYLVHDQTIPFWTLILACNLFWMQGHREVLESHWSKARIHPNNSRFISL